MEYTKIGKINEYVSQSINPMKTPDTVFEMYSVPVFDTGHPEYLRGDEIASSKIVVQKDDILLCKINPRINRVWVVGDESDKQNIASSEWIVIRNSAYNPEFLAWYFRTPKFQKLMTSEVTGIGGSLTRAQPKRVAEYPVPILKRSKQDEIVCALNKVKHIIDVRRQELKELDNLIKSRFVEMFGEPMTNSKGYELKTYGELFELNAGGTPSKQKPEYWDHGTISWIGSNMCQNAVICENDGNYITEEGFRHSSARMFPIDTVLVALVGATIGKTALLKFETTTNQNVLGIRGIRENGFVPEFVFYYTQGLYQKFLNIGDGGFAMASKGFISELPMPIVELSLQEQFANFVKQIDKLKFAVQQSLNETKTLMDSLMQQYFG